MAAAPEPTKRPPLKGNWGGEGAGVEVTEEGARLFFDCAKGSIEVPITPDEEGRFEVTGRYVKEGPGPTRPEQTQGVGARYLGQLEGNTLTFTTGLDTIGDQDGKFRYRVITTENGSLISEVNAAIIPVPAALWGGMMMLGGAGVLHKLRKRRFW